MVPDHLIQPPDDLRVCNVFAVPSQKVVDSVSRGNGDVPGIGCGLLGNDAALEDFGTQLDGLVVDFEDGQAFDRIDAFRAAWESPLPASSMTNSEMNTE